MTHKIKPNIFFSPALKRSGHKVPPLTEKLFAIGTSGKRKHQLSTVEYSPGSSNHTPVQAPCPWAVEKQTPCFCKLLFLVLFLSYCFSFFHLSVLTFIFCCISCFWERENEWSCVGKEIGALGRVRRKERIWMKYGKFFKYKWQKRVLGHMLDILGHQGNAI